MKKYFFTIASILVLVFGISSCSNEETKTQNQIAARPTVPLQNSEVQIGTQIWMTKNLNVSRYRNGDPIPQVADPTQWANLTTGAWCYYNNDSANGRIYGKLYNWYAVNDPRGLAPVGFHVSTDSEWTNLIDYLGGPVAARPKMLAFCFNLNNCGNNSSGFSAFFVGFRYDSGGFGEGGSAIWWSSSEFSGNEAWYRSIIFYSSSVDRYAGNKSGGGSVRCVKD